ncbi:MAG: hypothetical protein HN833_01680 [Elusimicrobiaceae bacterium]|jgi:hypothetical protein|nr:hypothetical protein [Elusimicrobiaceae bacterium]MBT3954594.1 hypothetical protein [Elusimicrobiaceae bacterium]MBT4007902.1 hypothetical protein [Elusimicrobiaceae bacterium]MBT4403125.1 hypothetical protein [Elusimicrobiaceae bacterium]MBT4439916.1 hypothetical protein [Elusimicrobiaceae bacterium]
MKKISLSLIALFFATSIYAYPPFDFELGARSSAMGGAYTAVKGDIYAVNYNPAADVEPHQAAADFSFGKNFINNASMFGYSGYWDEYQLTGFTGYIKGDNHKDKYLNLSGAKHHQFSLLPNYTHIGVSLKYIGTDYSNESYSDSAIDIDLGALHDITDSLSVGASILNVFGSRFYDFKQSRILRLGGAYEYFYDDYNQFAFSSDIVSSYGKWRLNLGSEYGYLSKYFVRLGYKGNYDDDTGITLGLGWLTSLFLGKLRLDYSLSEYENEDLQKLTVTFNF